VQRKLFREDHEQFRQSFRHFLEREVKPHQERWNEAGIVDREVWRKAGEAGFLCPWLEPEYGGAGGDFLHSVVVMEPGTGSDLAAIRTTAVRDGDFYVINGAKTFISHQPRLHGRTRAAHLRGHQ
jgi:acyl-CoA dehydrogenase